MNLSVTARSDPPSAGFVSFAADGGDESLAGGFELADPFGFPGVCRAFMAD
jgi:hypothetical protein